MRFSIVTPSFQQLDWLKLAIRSLEDQRVSFEHLIQDAGTGAELEAWVRDRSSSKLFVERDTGMYDALNRGFSRASGDIWAWLNCDEQYLFGALEAVAARFAEDPALDVLLADNLIVDSHGNYLAHRFSIVPTLSQLWVRFPVASCALFFRPRVWRPFDSQWKSAADWWWFRDMLGRGARVGLLRRFVAAFTETSVNLGLAQVTAREQARILAARPRSIRLAKPVLLAIHRWRMWRSGAFSVKPFRYALYSPQTAKLQLGRPPHGNPDIQPAFASPDAAERKEFFSAHPTPRWIRPGVNRRG